MKVADRWFVRSQHANGVTQLVEPEVHRIIRCNVWHVRGKERDLIVDTSVGVSSVAGALADLIDRPVTCVATHIHYDHVGCLHEFEERLMHPIAAAQMDPYRDAMPLRWSAFEEEAVEAVRASGYTVDSDEMLTALPSADFDIDGFRTKGVAATGVITEGDVIDLGDRTFEVLHLPGHTPCSIGLWEATTATLFSGDAIYDGPLIDFVPESDVATYIETMTRLRNMEVSTVHAGHDPSFDRERLVELADRYIQSRGG